MSRTPNSARPGLTLLELMVALAVVAALTAVATLAAHPMTPRRVNLADQVDSLRLRAMQSGRTQTAFLRDSLRYGAVVILPTGSLIADSSLRLAPLTGEVQP